MDWFGELERRHFSSCLRRNRLGGRSCFGPKLPGLQAAGGPPKRLQDCAVLAVSGKSDIFWIASFRCWRGQRRVWTLQQCVVCR
jgi:hypothetical protein